MTEIGRMGYCCQPPNYDRNWWYVVIHGRQLVLVCVIVGIINFYYTFIVITPKLSTFESDGCSTHCIAGTIPNDSSSIGYLICFDQQPLHLGLSLSLLCNWLDKLWLLCKYHLCHIAVERLLVRLPDWWKDPWLFSLPFGQAKRDGVKTLWIWERRDVS